MEHSPEPTLGAELRSSAAVLICPPLGYEEICASRPLRVLADALAGAGFVVLRLEWPTAGDGALDPGGNPDDDGADAVAAALRTISLAVEALRARGVRSITGIGLRAGALFALAAPGLDELVLWALPAAGRGYLREERAFQKLAARAFGSAPADARPIPAGGVEAGGFFYGAATVVSLEAMSAAELVAAHPRSRVLYIGRDGAAPPPAIAEALARARTVVEVSSASGLGDLLEDPYAAALHPDVEREILRWCGGSELAADSLGADNLVPKNRPADQPALTALPAATPATSLTLRGGVRERPWVCLGGAGELSGVICEPAGGALPGATWTLFLNAGGVRRCGPNRLWTRAARALAAEGRPSLRFDVHDVGDSDGVTVPRENLEEMYNDASLADVLIAYDWAREQGAGAIDVVGLCSGAFMGMHLAARRRVRQAVLFNAPMFIWNDDARASGMTNHIWGSLLDGRRWRRLLTGRIDAVELGRAIVNKSWITVRNRAERLAGRPPRDEVAELIELVRRRGTALRLVSSEGDPSIAYVEAHVQEEERPEITVIPAVDHTIRPLWAHARVLDLILDAKGESPP